MPGAVALLDIELQEGAGQGLRLPRRGRLAGPQPDDGIADSDRLARPEREIADDAVALVEEADHGDALRHRSHARQVCRDLRQADVDGIGNAFLLLPLLLRHAGTAAAGDEKQR